MEIMQAKMQEEVEALQTLQKQSSQALTARQTLDSQLNENQLVKEEMDALEEGAHVFKLIGPALVRQAVPEAQGNVDKRIAYITAELKRQETLLKTLEEKQDERRNTLQTMQNQMQKLAQA
ncbi:prefoldin subunit 6-like isoform X3 [Tigriopus californicus]|nr:prefoldin subunit 6-like isoform X3 [Tigriopus californicus]